MSGLIEYKFPIILTQLQRLQFLFLFFSGGSVVLHFCLSFSFFFFIFILSFPIHLKSDLSNRAIPQTPSSMDPTEQFPTDTIKDKSTFLVWTPKKYKQLFPDQKIYSLAHFSGTTFGQILDLQTLFLVLTIMVIMTFIWKELDGSTSNRFKCQFNSFVFSWNSAVWLLIILFESLADGIIVRFHSFF